MALTRFESAEAGRLKRYAVALAVLWTAVVGASLTWNMVQARQKIVEEATIRARMAYEKDVLYRLWSSRGVYAQVKDEQTAGSPVPEVGKDLMISSGRRLQFVSPKEIAREVHEMQKNRLGIRSRVVSLEPTHHDSSPDDWERQALNELFERGKTEYSSLAEVKGQTFLRLMRPLSVEQGCQDCHAAHGLPSPDIRGGLSISVPAGSLWKSSREVFLGLVLGHGFLWIFGLAVVGAGARSLIQGSTERERAYRQIRESEELARSIVHMAKDAIVCVDQKGNVILWNDAAESIFQYSTREMLGKGLTHLIPVLLRASHQQAFDKAMAAGQAPPLRTLYETHGLRADGSEFPAEISISIWTKNGKKFATAVIRDVTERDRMEQELREQRRQLDLAMLAGELGLWDSDLRTGTAVWSDQTLNIAGYFRGELEESVESWQRLIHPDDASRVVEAFNAHIADPTLPFEVEYRIKTKTGEWKWVMSAGKAVEFDKKGEVLRIIGVCRDIDRNKRNELERESLIVQLQQALDNIRRLSGLLPICSSCKKIRDDKGYWQEVELYVRDHSEADFTHGICPECARKLYPEIFGDD